MKKTTLFCVSSIALFLIMNAGVQYARHHMTYEWIIKEGDEALMKNVNVQMSLSNQSNWDSSFSWKLKLENGEFFYTHELGSYASDSQIDVFTRLQIEDDVEKDLSYQEYDETTDGYHSYYPSTTNCTTYRADVKEAQLSAQFHMNTLTNQSLQVIRDQEFSTGITVVSGENNQIYGLKRICDQDDVELVDIYDDYGTMGASIKEMDDTKTFYYMPRIKANMKGTASIYQLQLQEVAHDDHSYYSNKNDYDLYDVIVQKQYDFPLNQDTEAVYLPMGNQGYLFQSNTTKSTLSILNQELEVIDTIPLQYSYEDMKNISITQDQDHLIVRIKNQIDVYDAKGKKVFETSIEDLKQMVVDLHYQDGYLYLLSFDELEDGYYARELNPNVYALKKDEVKFHGVLHFHDDSMVRSGKIINSVAWNDLRFER